MNRRACAAGGALLLVLGVVGCPNPPVNKQVVTPILFCTVDGDCTSTVPPCGTSVSCNTDTNQCEFDSKCNANEVCDKNQCCSKLVNQACGKCGSGKYNCFGQCVEGTCCSACDPGWTRGNFQGQPDPNGSYCVIQASTPGGDIDLAKPSPTPYITSAAPPGCDVHQCGARAVLGMLNAVPGSSCIPNDSGAAIFRCDGDVAGEASLFLTDLKDTYPTPGDGPQFPCKQKLEILSGIYTSKCSLRIDKVDWTGAYPACF